MKGKGLSEIIRQEWDLEWYISAHLAKREKRGIFKYEIESRAGGFKEGIKD